MFLMTEPSLHPHSLCSSLSLFILAVIGATGVRPPSTPPELKLTFRMGVAQGEQRKIQLQLTFVPTIGGLWEHALARSSG